MNRRFVIKALPVIIAGMSSASSMLRLVARAKSSEWLATTDQEKDLEAIAEAIIPETETPGAIAAGVPAFIILAVAELLSEEENRAFDEGLVKFSTDCNEQHGTPFFNLDSVQQITYLTSLEKSGDTFFKEIKKWTLFGYFTSEVGMTQALLYNPIPGQFEPCVKVTPQTKADATYY